MNYKNAHLIANSNFVYPFEAAVQEALLYYAALGGATAAVKSDIRTAYAAGMNGADNFKAFQANADPYLAYLKDYVWGSNSTKASQGMLFADMITFGIDATKNADSQRAAERYIHYIHGLNPLGFVYLSNMFDYGAVNGVRTFYHTWFTDGSKLWDVVGTSTYGPPPGYLTGGPNPGYKLDSCCASGCNGNSCTTEPVSPPQGQPAQKSYKDFNSNWPIDSWQVTENSDAYQVAYIRLLSKFVK